MHIMVSVNYFLVYKQTYVKSKILSGTHCLPDKKPSLRYTINGT
jgi:hypothetical protein